MITPDPNNPADFALIRMIQNGIVCRDTRGQFNFESIIPWAIEVLERSGMIHTRRQEGWYLYAATARGFEFYSKVIVPEYAANGGIANSAIKVVGLIETWR